MCVCSVYCVNCYKNVKFHHRQKSMEATVPAEPMQSSQHLEESGSREIPMLSMGILRPSGSHSNRCVPSWGLALEQQS